LHATQLARWHFPEALSVDPRPTRCAIRPQFVALFCDTPGSRDRHCSREFRPREVRPVRPVSMRYPLSKFTAAVILPSPATLAPWGDDGWRFAGAMQLVADGPDWLYAQWPSLDGTESGAADGEPARFASLVLRELPPERAEDIAVMAFALLGVDGWRDLEHWWGDPADRKRHRDQLVAIAGQYAAQYKLAVMVTADTGVAPAVLDYLEDLGFRTELFTASETT
jgi:hypothetical protein